MLFVVSYLLDVVVFDLCGAEAFVRRLKGPFTKILKLVETNKKVNSNRYAESEHLFLKKILN